jgi:hypothetical protein
MQSERTLIELPDTFAVCRLSPEASIPAWATEDEFFSITRTSQELSIVCRQDSVPETIQCERGWRCLQLVGPIPFSVVGVVAGLTVPLAEAGIGVFVLSTYDTDYLLAKQKDWTAALDVLRRQGYSVI